MGRIVWDPDWPLKAGARVRLWMNDVLGPEIAADAKIACPKRTGKLAESIGHHMDGDVLIVDAGPWDTPSGPYAAYVAIGHVNYRDAHGTFRRLGDPRIVSGPEIFPPQPFLQVALYQERAFHDF